MKVCFSVPQFYPSNVNNQQIAAPVQIMDSVYFGERETLGDILGLRPVQITSSGSKHTLSPGQERRMQDLVDKGEATYEVTSLGRRVYKNK